MGSVVCAFYEVGTVDGMNEKGLVANTLYLVESDYGKPDGKTTSTTITPVWEFLADPERDRGREPGVEDCLKCHSGNGL